ncbi:type II toxin-antitoxin system RelE/ParE family toxin [Citricoccus sp. NPDC055426]|uniref:type II toxin-antitoxin system RelE/ParE family toxin n=1 Tax=Citricoccus sp. NPDC055426 TaxID=3155536 RepID=UPI00343B6180
MTYAVHLTPSARRDRDHILAWYDTEAPHQTGRFIDEFYALARRLSEFPQSTPVVYRGTRRASLKVFPYQIWYRIHENTRLVEIIAVLHHRQNPSRAH